MEKRQDLVQVDHSKIEYEEFRKDFYLEPAELKFMRNLLLLILAMKEVEARRKAMDDIVVRGLKCPKPVESWTQMGTSFLTT